jgi:hypothetical protein
MSLINRPFRGFSGVYTPPLPALLSPSSTSTSLDSQRSTSDSSITCADAAPKPPPRRSLFHRAKTSPHNKHLRVAAPDAAANANVAADRPAPPCRAHTAEVPAGPPQTKGRFTSLLRKERGEKTPSAEELERELEELYVAVYSKAERRAFFREWKARQEEHDAWEVDEFERGVVYDEER